MSSYYTRDEVRKFVDAMKNSKFVLRGCETFVAEEQRDVVYIVSVAYRLAHSSRNDLVLAIKALLVSWNWQLLVRSLDLQRSLENDIRESVEDAQQVIHELEAEKLGTVNIDQRSDQIKKAFDIFSGKSSIGITGASKALHVINPEFFVMWDNSIRKVYHRIHDDYGVKWSPEGRCYTQFMATCNDIAASLATEQEWLTTNHPSFVNYAFRKTVPKMIDECNYVRFFLNKEWNLD